jgi:ABC-type transport system involved in multi-copper enzyme maturation permease subunit
MTTYFIRAVRFEFAKIMTSRTWWIVFGIVAVIQPLLALVEAISLAQSGIHATPETHPMLAEALPPLDYFGFDVIPLGQAAVVVLGGIAGASVFRSHELRTNLLCLNRRRKTFLAKLLAVFAGSTVVSFISVFATIAITHLGLGSQGLHFLVLSPVTWQFIGYATLDWVLLTILSFGFGMISRNAIVPLLVMVPQVVGLGGLLAQKWEWSSCLPVAAGNLLFATPTNAIAHDPVKGGLILAAWTAVVLLVAAFLFVRRDVGGSH